MASRGAYGLILGLDGAESLTNAAPPTWRPWTLEVRQGDGGAVEAIDDDRATAPVASGGHVLVERTRSRTLFTLPKVPSPELLMHPLLAFTAVVVARWRGQQSFHGGAFLHDGAAWGVLGAKDAGKSSLLASLRAAGQPILADDVIVVEDGRCLAGPRSLDLRTASFPDAEPLGVIGDRERWRLRLEAVPAETPLGGWVVLEWGATSVAPVAPADRLAVLVENLSVRLPPTDLEGLMDCAALPMVRFSRPRDWGGLSAATQSLIGAL